MKARSRGEAYSQERKMQDEWAKRDFDRERMIEEVHKESIKRIQGKIDDFYMKYASDSGLTRQEANRVLKDFNVPDWANKAKIEVDKAIADKAKNPSLHKFKMKNKLDYFSPETNKWLRAYNAKMKISRLELLKGELEIELQKMYAQDHAIIDTYLTEEYRAELKRQAGILGMSSSGVSKNIENIINADFYGANFSEAIWGRNGHYDSTRKEVFKSLNRFYTDMGGYREIRRDLMKKFEVTEYESMRLLRTECSRIRNTAQMNTYKEHDFDYFVYVTESGACSECAWWEGKAIPVDGGSMGFNVPPLHPNCRCHTYGVIRMDKKDGTSNLDEYDIWDGTESPQDDK